MHLGKVRTRSSRACVRTMKLGYISSLVHWTCPLGVFMFTTVISTSESPRNDIFKPDIGVPTEHLWIIQWYSIGSHKQCLDALL